MKLFFNSKGWGQKKILFSRYKVIIFFTVEWRIDYLPLVAPLTGNINLSFYPKLVILSSNMIITLDLERI